MSTLAILGGSPVRTAPFPSWPVGTDKDLDALKSVDLSESGGNSVRHLAKRFAAFNDVPYCVPVANGTVSLEMILKALGIGYGDEVILPAYTFIATLSSIVYANATPVFADIEPGTYNLSVTDAERKITPKTKAIVAVAIGGQPFDVIGFEALAKKYGIFLIVDAAQAVGARVKDRSFGSYGIAASFSCQNTKNLTAGEGGFITTKDPALYERLLSLKGNEMTASQAVLLDSQMDHLEKEIQTRSQNAAFLDEALKKNPLFSPMELSEDISIHAYHLYRLRVNTDLLKSYGLTREDVILAIHQEGLNIGGGYLPLYDNPAVASKSVQKRIGCSIDLTPLPVTQKASYEEGLWFEQQLLLGTKQDLQDIANIFQKVSEHLKDLAEAKAQGKLLKPAAAITPAESKVPTTLEEILFSGVWGTYGPLEKETVRLYAQKKGYAYGVMTHSFEAAIQTVLRSLELAYGDSVALEGSSPLLTRAANAAVDIGQSVKDPSTKESFVTLKDGNEAIEVLVEDKIYAVVSDESSSGMILTDHQGTYERLFAYHFCGHRPDEGTANPNPDSGNIVGGDMRVTEWQALHVYQTL